jgi:hypothetical protein
MPSNFKSSYLARFNSVLGVLVVYGIVSTSRTVLYAYLSLFTALVYCSNYIFVYLHVLLLYAIIVAYRERDVRKGGRAGPAGL